MIANQQPVRAVQRDNRRGNRRGFDRPQQAIVRSVGHRAEVGHDVGGLEDIFDVTIGDGAATFVRSEQPVTKRSLTSSAGNLSQDAVSGVFEIRGTNGSSSDCPGGINEVRGDPAARRNAAACSALIGSPLAWAASWFSERMLGSSTR